MRTSRAVFFLSVVALGTIVLVSCGGGGGGGGGTTPPTPRTLVIAMPTVPDGMIGEPYTLQLTAQGGTGTIRWSINFGDAWASIDAATGRISGTPPNAGSHFISVNAQDAASVPQIAQIGIEIFVSSPMQMSGIPADVIRAYPYDWRAQILGGKWPFTASVVSGTLPDGLAMAVEGGTLRFFGAATSAGTYPITVRVRDAASTQQTLDHQLSLKVISVLKITSGQLKNAVVGRSYSDTMQSVNGVAPLNWQILNSTGRGLAINSTTGTISGTPTEWGSSSILISVTDSSAVPQTDSKWVPITIYDVLRVDTPMTSVIAHVSEFASTPIYQRGGVSPINVTVASGSLPPGMRYEYGAVSGNPTSTGTWNFGLHYSDSAVPPQTYDHPVVITVLPPLPVIASYPPTPVVGEPYSFQMVANKGTSPYRWDLIAGMFPGGLSISQGGLISGIPVEGGEYSARLRVTDSATPSQSSELTVNFTLLPKALGRNDTVATATVVSISFSNGASLSPYDDPPGTVAPDTDYYKLYATTGAEVTIYVQAFRQHVDTVLEIVGGNGIRYTTCKDPADDSPAAPIVNDATPNAFDDECLNDDIDIGVVRSSRLAFKVPGESGKITTFFAHVLDFQGMARPDVGYDLNVSGALEPLRIITVPNIQLTKGRFEQVQMTAYGGSSPYAWTLASGTVPSGMSLNSSGLLSGTPTAVGNWVFTLNASDSSNPVMTATKTFGVIIREPLAITTTSIPGGQTGVPYIAQLAWTGGMGPYTVSTNGLAPGLVVDSRTGAIRGTPTAPGTYSVNFTVGDKDFQYASKSLNLSIGLGPLYIATTTLPNATKNAIYSALVQGEGGKQPFSWQLTSGALPPGMTLNTSTGELRGIPTSSGVFSFTVKVTDANAATSTATLQLTVQ